MQHLKESDLKYFGKSKKSASAEMELLTDHLGLRYKVAAFPELDRGDCKMWSAKFFYYENGQTHFECQIASDDSGDEWWGTFGGGLPGSPNDINAILFVVNPVYHFDIHDSHTVKNWAVDHNPGDNSYKAGLTMAQIFDQLTTITFDCRC